MQEFIDSLSRISSSNLAVAALLVSIVLLLGLLYMAPDLEATFTRTGTPGNARTGLRARMLRQLRLLRTPDRSTREQATRSLYRDGLADGPIVTDSDFFMFLKIGLMIVLAFIGLALSIVFGSPFMILLPFLGWIGPHLYAWNHNRGRRKQITANISPALQRLETRIAAGADLREAFAKVGSKKSGPLFAELAWASRQMAIPGNDVYEVLRQLAVRNDMYFFTQMADRMELASRRSENDARQALLTQIDRILDDADHLRAVKMGGLPNKVTVGIMVFMLPGMFLAMAGGFIASVIGGPSW